MAVMARHVYEEVHFNKPTWCDECRGFFASPFGKQGLRCCQCQRTSHTKCLAVAMARPCLESHEKLSSSGAAAASSSSSAPRTIDEGAAFSGDPSSAVFLNENILCVILALLLASDIAKMRRVCHRFARVGRANPVLTTLDLSRSARRVTIDAIPLPALKNVTDLSLASCVRLRHDGVIAVLRACPHLRKLDLSYLRGHVTAALLQAALPSLTCLCSLNISSTRAAGAAELSQFAPRLPTTLRTLIMSDFLYGDSYHAASLPALATWCPHLESLNLNRLNEGQYGVPPLVLVPLGNLPLTSLSLAELDKSWPIEKAPWPIEALRKLGPTLRKFEHSGRFPPPFAELGWVCLEEVSVTMLMASTIEFLASLPLLRCLSYHLLCSDTNEQTPKGAVLQLLDLSRLESLTIINNMNESFSDADLNALCVNCPHLTSFAVSLEHSPKCTTAGLAAFASRMTRLRSLRLDTARNCKSPWEWSDPLKEPLLALLRGGHLTQLEEIGIGGDVTSPENGKLLAKLPKLKEVAFHYAVKHLDWSSVFVPGVIYASLTNINVSDATLDALIAATKACPRLTTLAFAIKPMKEEPMTYPQWQALVAQWSGLASLFVSVGYDWKFDDKYCIAIGNSCKNLRELIIHTPRLSASVADGMEYHRITEEGISAIAAGCPVLLHLCFDSSKVKELPLLSPHLTVSGWVDPNKRNAEVYRLKHSSAGSHGPCIVQ